MKRFLLIIGFLLWAQIAFAQTSSSQEVIGDWTSGSSFATSSYSATTHKLLSVTVAFIASDNSNVVTGCSDATNGAYTAIDSLTNSNAGSLLSIYTFYAKDITGGTLTTTCTATTSSVVAARMWVDEINGADLTAPLDQHFMNHQTNPGTGTGVVTSTAQTTTSDGQFIVGVAIGENGGVTMTGDIGAGFTSGNNTAQRASEYKVQTSAGSIAATFTVTFGDIIDTLAGIATFKAAGGGGGGTIVQRRSLTSPRTGTRTIQ